MADDLEFQAVAAATLPPATVVATDDVGGRHFQRVKLDQGADGLSSPVTDLATNTTLTANGVLTGAVDETAPATDTASSGLNGRLQRVCQKLTTLIALLPGYGIAGSASANVVTVQGSAAEDAALAGSPLRHGFRASAALPSAMSADNDIVTGWADLRGRQVTKQQCGTATTSSVADSATNVTILAANTARLGATVYNDSDQALYLKLGATATATDFTVKMAAGSYYEVPFGYSGILDGIWVSNSTGSARITELT